MPTENTTTEAMRIIWHIYSDSWSKNDPEERLALFDRFLHSDCVYTDPATQITGFK